MAGRAAVHRCAVAEVEARLAELARTRDQLAALAARAAAQDPADCQGYCSIIAPRYRWLPSTFQQRGRPSARPDPDKQLVPWSCSNLQHTRF